ncbi:hypothetical protein Hanom_Chr12g01134451 [Helianthus anomalus]
MIIMLQVPMSSSESGLSNAHDPMAIISADEIVPELEIFTSDTESDPDMLSDDEDDFQPFALPDLGDDTPIADGIPVEDIFALPAAIHDHLIIVYPDGEHIVTPILDPVPLMVIPPEDWPFDNLFDDDVDLFLDGTPADAQGDGEVDDVVVLDVPPPAILVIEISSDSSLHSVADSFESVTSSALRAAGHQLHATDSNDDTAMSAAPSSPVRAPTPLTSQSTSLIQTLFRLVCLILHHLSQSRFPHHLISHLLIHLYHSPHRLVLLPHLHLCLMLIVLISRLYFYKRSPLPDQGKAPRDNPEF